MASMAIRVLRSDSSEDLASLQRVLEAAPSYWMRVSAQLPKSSTAKKVFDALPEGKAYEDKFVLGIFDSQSKMIGCVDLIRGYPDPKTAMLGLLFIAEPAQGKGYGKQAYNAIEQLVLSWNGFQKIRIGVVATNGIALPFWKSLGFVESGTRRPHEDNGVVSETIVLEKAIR